MLLTPHAIIGAAVYFTIPNPWIALPLAFASHFLADAIPHWHYHKKDPRTGDFLLSFDNFLKVSADLVVVVLLIGLISIKRQDFIFAAASFLGMLPDGIYFLDKLSRRFQPLHIISIIFAPLNVFHQTIHAKSDSFPGGALFQLLLSAAIFTLVLWT